MEPVLLLSRKVGSWSIDRLGHLQLQDVHRKIHENLSISSEVTRGGLAYIHYNKQTKQMTDDVPLHTVRKICITLFICIWNVF